MSDDTPNCCSGARSLRMRRAPGVVERRNAANGGTARENIVDLVDAGSFCGNAEVVNAAQLFEIDDVIDPVENPSADGRLARRRPASEPRVSRPRFGDTWSPHAV